MMRARHSQKIGRHVQRPYVGSRDKDSGSTLSFDHDQRSKASYKKEQEAREPKVNWKTRYATWSNPVPAFPSKWLFWLSIDGRW